jgi:hypothetical protein
MGFVLQLDCELNLLAVAGALDAGHCDRSLPECMPQQLMGKS